MQAGSSEGALPRPHDRNLPAPRYRERGLLGSAGCGKIQDHANLHRGAPQPGSGQEELGGVQGRSGMAESLRRIREKRQDPRQVAGIGLHGPDGFLQIEITWTWPQWPRESPKRPHVPWVRAVDLILVSHLYFCGWSSLTVRSWMYHVFFAIAMLAALGLIVQLRRPAVFWLVGIYGFFWLGQLYNVLLQ